MTYCDEEIISKRIAKQKLIAHSIDNEVNIEGIAYTFDVRDFAPDFSMIIPESFDIMKPEHADIKYPYFDRPKTILTNEDTTVNITLDISPPATNTLNERILQYRAVVKRLHPSNVFLAERIYNLPNEINVACYDYISSAIDANIYNLSFFTDLPTGELFGWFTCPADLKKKWEPLARQMIQTIKLLPQNE